MAFSSLTLPWYCRQLPGLLQAASSSSFVNTVFASMASWPEASTASGRRRRIQRRFYRFLHSGIRFCGRLDPGFSCLLLFRLFSGCLRGSQSRTGLPEPDSPVPSLRLLGGFSPFPRTPASAWSIRAFREASGTDASLGTDICAPRASVSVTARHGGLCALPHKALVTLVVKIPAARMHRTVSHIPFRLFIYQTPFGMTFDLWSAL